ncbi:hypothetical protein F4802DRAFT_591239 [Xylaria palmicola]|nr:hypothetical protein F4802DRAFT_591239 [Xylaria palmicola]
MQTVQEVGSVLTEESTCSEAFRNPLYVESTKTSSVVMASDKNIDEPITVRPPRECGEYLAAILRQARVYDNMVAHKTHESAFTDGTPTPLIVNGTHTPVITNEKRAPIIVNGSHPPIVANGSHTPAAPAAPVIAHGTHIRGRSQQACRPPSAPAIRWNPQCQEFVPRSPQEACRSLSASAARWNPHCEEFVPRSPGGDYSQPAGAPSSPVLHVVELKGVRKSTTARELEDFLNRLLSASSPRDWNFWVVDGSTICLAQKRDARKLRSMLDGILCKMLKHTTTDLERPT